MSNKRSFGGLVGTALGLAVAVIQSTHPSWLGNHPWILTVSLVFLGFSLILWLMQFRWFQRMLLGAGESAAQDSMPGNHFNQSVGRDNSGRLFAAEQIHYHENSSKADSVAAEAPAIRRPNLIALTPLRVSGSQFAYGASFQKNMPYVLPIENRIPTVEAGAVAISIRFRSGAEEIAYIQRAYWLEHQYPVATIEVGTVQSVVMGRYLNRAWIGFENTYRRRAVYAIADADSYPRPVEKKLPFRSNELTAEVLLFNSESGDEYLRATFTISELEDNDVKVQRVK